MHRSKYIFYIISFVFFTGCTQLGLTIDTPKAISDEEFLSLQEKIKNLEPLQKQIIYSELQSDIHKYKKQSDKAYASGYHAQAIDGYEIVNFYEGRDIIALKKMKRIAKYNSAYHYKRALACVKTDKKKFIRELNKVMINNPEYKDSKELLNQAKIEMWKFLSEQENKLYQTLIENTGSVKDLKTLSKEADALRVYEYDNNNVLKADKELDKYYETLLEDSIKKYKSSGITVAKKAFKDFITIYKNDAIAKQYLAKIKAIENKDLNLKEANKALEESQYKQAIEYAKKVLDVEKGNPSANSIIEKAKEESIKQIASLVSMGKLEYNNRNLDKAKKTFEMVLVLDSKNAEALIYYNKIKRQLETIHKLK